MQMEHEPVRLGAGADVRRRSRWAAIGKRMQAKRSQDNHIPFTSPPYVGAYVPQTQQMHID